MLRVRVRDTGMGIAPENLERLFDPFFTTKPNGTGLGLPITRRIIEEHRGRVKVESELNAGTTFSILLPFLLKRP
jgi:signal transduction histidine kinase